MGLMTTIRLLAAAALVTTALLGPPMASGQPAAASCTASLLTSFTPCFSFLTSNSSNGSPPTRECCRSLAALVNASTGCACLVLTGAVPLPALGVPINRTLAVSLPKACDSMSVPLQCRDTSSAQSPAPGPVADTPSTPASTPEAPAAPTVDPTATAPVSQGQTRPMVLPSSARRTTSAHVAAAPALALLLAVAAALV
ncbi:non-specific lipid transfer protein GPI-anchored 20-like [Miscanthus floridulus]|uniref:non-specific lipid transfer protein GPI-anchored 20-like n=1 Tax=Miscanthus floridulus TaxID=154761 RepID=UPI00345977E9